ncbi:MAG: alkaline phosphatase family protein [Planctomycetota bacterium]|nr:alkaline phosphatase family protein [Planctomycetota bacterium]
MKSKLEMRRRGAPFLAAGLALVFGACGGGEEPPLDPVDPVVVIGIDGVDPLILADLLEAGRLPNFARFADEGSLVRLATFAPTFSPVIWTSIATGQDAAAHGVTDFLDDRDLPFTSNARQVPAIWNLASDAGRTVDCVGWWITWPAERVEGRLVASYAAQAQAKIIWKPTIWEAMPEQTWPPELQQAIKPFVILANEAADLHDRMRGAFPIPGEVDDYTGRIINDLAWTLAADLSVSAITRHLMQTGDSDLTLAYLALPDVAGHRFWRYHAPGDVRYEVPAEELELFGDFVNLSYVEADRQLGQLLAEVPANATVVLLSDHGMHVDPQNIYEPEALASGAHEDAPDGIIGVLGPKAAKLGARLELGQAPLGDVYQVAPLLLHLLEVPVPRHWRAVQKPAIPLERLLDEGWRVEHPLVLGPNPDAAFRPATPSILPMAGSNTTFREAFEALGYLGDDQPRAPSGDGSTKPLGKQPEDDPSNP